MVLIKVAGNRAASLRLLRTKEVSGSCVPTNTGGTTRTPAAEISGKWTRGGTVLGRVIPVIGIIQVKGETSPLDYSSRLPTTPKNRCCFRSQLQADSLKSNSLYAMWKAAFASYINGPRKLMHLWPTEPDSRCRKNYRTTTTSSNPSPLLNGDRGHWTRVGDRALETQTQISRTPHNQQTGNRPGLFQVLVATGISATW
jgi:hypothetical protein